MRYAIQAASLSASNASASTRHRMRETLWPLTPEVVRRCPLYPLRRGGRCYLTKNGDQMVRTKGAASTSMAAITDADAAKWVKVLVTMGAPQERPIDRIPGYLSEDRWMQVMDCTPER